MPRSSRRAFPPGDAVDAAVELAKLARLLPAVILAPLADREAAALARRESVLTLSAGDIFDYQATAARSLRRVAEARVPLVDSEATQIIAFRPSDGGIEHLAILIGDPDPAGPVLTRLHSECFTGDLLGSLRCDCGDQLRGAIGEIARTGGGVLLYLAQEGRGIGLVNKLRAYQLQDFRLRHGRCQRAARLRCRRAGLSPGRRDAAAAALPARPPADQQSREDGGARALRIAVTERVPHIFPANGHNERYLRTKATRSGHLL